MLTKTINSLFVVVVILLAAAGAVGIDGQAAEPTPRPDISLTLTADSLARLPSGWPDYFGTHYANSPEGAGRWWNTVRSYGGTHVGIYPSGEAPPTKGPFAGKEIRISLSDFHARLNRSGKTAEQLIPELVQSGMTGIYLMTSIVPPSLEPFDKDLAYRAVYQIHKAYPKANRCLAWQIGNEVVSSHFDPKGLKQEKPLAAKGTYFGYDLKRKEDFYVEDYLAPAIEAIERASRDVYGDPRKIKILLGSMNPYNDPNRRFLKNVLDRTFEGRNAPSLKGEPVWKHIDVLTVHYMFGSDQSVETMQQYYDLYLKTGRLSGIWITEEHGQAGKGPVTVIERGFRFLSWAARNGLSADQTRLVWWGDSSRKPGGSAREAEQLLGDFLAGQPLFLLDQKQGAGHLYVVCDELPPKTTRILLALVPSRSAAMKVGTLRLLPFLGDSSRTWTAETVQYSAAATAQKSTPKAVGDGKGIAIKLDRTITEPCVVLLMAAK